MVSRIVLSYLSLSLKHYNCSKLGDIILILQMKTLRYREVKRLALEERNVFNNTKGSVSLGSSLEEPLIKINPDRGHISKYRHQALTLF